MKQILQIRDLLRSAVPQRAEVEILQNEEGQSTIQIRLGAQHAILLPVGAGKAEGAAQELLVLNHVSPREKDRLRALEASFVDLGGDVHLNLPFLVVDRTGLQPEVRSQRGEFSASTQKVIHALLLAEAGRTWTTRDLARAAGVSPATVSRAVRDLGDLGVIVDIHPGARTRSEITVPDKERLLLEWAERSHWARHPRVDLMAPVVAAGRWWEVLNACLEVRWAVTLHAGAALWAPHVATEDIHLYVDVSDEGQLRRLAVPLRAVPSPRGNLHLLWPKDPGAVWAHVETRAGVPVVELHRLVVDLWHHPLRGREQAEHLLETVLRPRWEGG
jgi:hypothetical protein